MGNRMKRYLAIAVLALVVAGPLALPAQGADPKPAIKIDKPAAMNASKQVVVGSFVVAFLTERRDSAKAGGGLLGSGFGGKSSARSTLAGLTDADFQAATDAATIGFELDGRPVAGGAGAAVAPAGGGAAGVELALALASQVPKLTLLTASHLLSGHPPALRRRALVGCRRPRRVRLGRRRFGVEQEPFDDRVADEAPDAFIQPTGSAVTRAMSALGRAFFTSACQASQIAA